MKHPEDDEREKAEVHLREEEGDRVILAGIDIPASSKVIWAVLTDYDNLETFVPDMIQSRILERGEEGLIRLEQISANRFLFLKKRVRVVLQVSERLHRKNRICPDRRGFPYLSGVLGNRY